jgi:iron(III) transport system ATP-binding protein
MATERAQRPAEPPAGLTIERVSHAFGDRRVVHQVDIDLPAGEVHCLVGPSGCGKTTILRLVAGLEPLQGGRILIGGEVVATPGRALPPERRRVGLMFQDFALFPHLRVIDNVAFGLRHLAVAERRRHAQELLAQVDMAGHALSYPHMLSGGEQQRVALARALAPRPRLMLLDEPFSSLDAHLREHVRDDCIALLRASGTPVLMVTHEAEEAVRVGDRIHVMHDGRILQSGAPAELYGRPANPFVAEFFGPLNRFKGWVLAGEVSTPLGPVPARELQDGTPVDILIRPEALRPVQRRHGSPGPHFAVRRIQDRGTNRIIELAVPDGPMISVRTTASAHFETGDDVVVEVDALQVYVYPNPKAQRPLSDEAG